MWVAFSFSGKNINVFTIFQDRNFNVKLAKHFVTFWTTWPWTLLRKASIRKSPHNNREITVWNTNPWPLLHHHHTSFEPSYSMWWIRVDVLRPFNIISVISRRWKVLCNKVLYSTSSHFCSNILFLWIPFGICFNKAKKKKKKKKKKTEIL